MKKVIEIIILAVLVGIIGGIVIYNNKNRNSIEEIENKEITIEDNILDSNYVEEIEEKEQEKIPEETEEPETTEEIENWKQSRK